MPFKIIRNDITKVKADAIVNTANPKPIYSGGTDCAIYQAAGADRLLEERQAIGEIARGEARATPAFDLPARFIIHTVGPIWKDGKHGEYETLMRCYRNSLDLASSLGCESIAFPLIATGIYGFPRDKALQIAVSAFSTFLMDSEMQIILVVFDKRSYQLSANLMGEIDSFIDSNYVSERKAAEYTNNNSRGRRILHEEDERAAVPGPEEHKSQPAPAQTPVLSSEKSLKGEGKIDDLLTRIGPSFHDRLFELIDDSGMSNADVWKKANLDRKHFSKIQCDVHCHPKKKTVMALCIALQLDLEQAKDLMARADWAFSPSSKLDLIVEKAILDRKYDIMQLNMVLFEYTNETLGV